jgi:putative flavoprotein involved in K+ transport
LADPVDERVETLVIGGGQAGLAMSHMLSKRGCPHLVVERGRVAERWRSERWDGLHFQFPNWSVQLPDFPFAASDPDAFATKQDILKYIEAYAAFVKPPLRSGVAVTRLRRGPDGKGFVAETSEGTIASDSVVVATGPYQQPKLPDLLRDHDNLFQVHASGYTNPGQLPSGAVLVIGSGASGAQITEELIRAGRRVFLSVGRHRRVPRRYRRRDLMWWLYALGRDKMTAEQRGPDRLLPLITGAYGGHTVDLRRYAAEGVTLLGHLSSARDGVLQFADDLAENIRQGDASYNMFLSMAHEHVASAGLDMPEDPAAHERLPKTPGIATPPAQLDLRAENINAVIWATGYTLDFSWIDLPVIKSDGEPIHHHGITEIPGLYFIGLQWLSKMMSSFLSGVGDDAARLADHVLKRRGSSNR